MLATVARRESPFWIPAPRLHEDKLCGNDKWGVQKGRATLHYTYPQEWGTKGG